MKPKRPAQKTKKTREKTIKPKTQSLQTMMGKISDDGLQGLFFLVLLFLFLEFFVFFELVSLVSLVSLVFSPVCLVLLLKPLETHPSPPRPWFAGIVAVQVRHSCGFAKVPFSIQLFADILVFLSQSWPWFVGSGLRVRSSFFDSYVCGQAFCSFPITVTLCF